MPFTCLKSLSKRKEVGNKYSETRDTEHLVYLSILSLGFSTVPHTHSCSINHCEINIFTPNNKINCYSQYIMICPFFYFHLSVFCMDFYQIYSAKQHETNSFIHKLKK